MAAITVERLTKRYGGVVAVEDLSFALEPGTITGFLGRNGAGKTTTLRVLLGLAAPTSGTATFGGRPIATLAEPARTVGAVLDARFHPGRTGRDHLRVLATAARIPTARVDELLGLVGLAGAAGRRAGGYSLGMRQRLALAAALLGDPEVLVLDEPTNGLDPDGVVWLRTLLRSFRDQGRTVLVSSHQLAEVAQTVDDVVIIERGRLVSHGPVAALGAATALHVRTPEVAALTAALAARGIAAEAADGGLTVRGATPEEVGRAVAAAGVVVYELRSVERSLEELFFALTNERSA
ncbi:MAG TPA: ATP-binding cassette domain-containing protein [Frankiaceae bacterium]|nr:ATP-binding cassette domain-containing protein [Frankiaceae bacterium]